jgi:hypothetical protein
MAIDTQNKRRSAIRVLPIPDGSIDSADRRHALGYYRFGEVDVLPDGPGLMFKLPRSNGLFLMPSSRCQFKLPRSKGGSMFEGQK